jgi:cytochrome c biogenesis protein CcmG, thiol:disulfide interchange protein DsbE
MLEDVLSHAGSTIQRSCPMPARFDFACLLLFALGPSVAACGDAEKGADSAAEKGDLVGNPAPEFKVTAVAGTGGTISLKALRGQVVLLDFWGTFCEPCKKSFPKLEELNRKYAKSGLRVIGISEDEDDDKDKIPGFAETYGAKFSLAWDRDKVIARRYNPETMPSSFIIDRDGIVRFAHVGFHDGEEVQVESEIRGLLGH